MELTEAINKLRPQFVEHDRLRKEIINLNKSQSSTYFATIPLDICNIIRDFVPELRQSYTNEQFLTYQRRYEHFIKKARESPYNDNLNVEKILRQQKKSPDLYIIDPMVSDTDNYLMIKLTSNGQIMISSSYRELSYMGGNIIAETQNHCKTISNAFTGSILHKNVLIEMDISFRFILPCGLVVIKLLLIDSCDIPTIIYDPVGNNQIIIDKFNKDTAKENDYIKHLDNDNISCADEINLITIDDFGKMHIHRGYSEMYAFSPFCGHFMLRRPA